jgi:hypothetical protein
VSAEDLVDQAAPNNQSRSSSSSSSASSPVSLASSPSDDCSNSSAREGPLVSSSSPCCECSLACDGVHHYGFCRKIIHAICGSPFLVNGEEEEGYGSRRICRRCSDRRAVSSGWTTANTPTKRLRDDTYAIKGAAASKRAQGAAAVIPSSGVHWKQMRHISLRAKPLARNL